LNIASAPVIEVDAEAMFNNSTIQYRNKMKANHLGFYTSDIYTQADALPSQQHPSISTIDTSTSIIGHSGTAENEKRSGSLQMQHASDLIDDTCSMPRI
jgi:hypothetical protein